MSQPKSKAGRSMMNLTNKNKQIARRVVNGERMAHVAKDEGLSRARLFQVIRKYCQPYFMPSEWAKMTDKESPEKVRTNEIIKKVKSILDNMEALR